MLAFAQEDCLELPSSKYHDFTSYTSLTSVTMAQTTTIYESPYPDMLIPTDMSMSQYMVRSNPDDVADDKVIFSDLEEPHDSVTYAGLREDTAKNAAWLQSIGLQPGDTVAMYATNSVAWIMAAHAVVWAGGVLAGINAVVSEFELPHYLSVAKPKFVFVDPNLRSRVDAAFRELSTQPQRVIELGTTRGQGFPSNVPHQQPIPPYAVPGDNRNVPAVLLFSSGMRCFDCLSASVIDSSLQEPLENRRACFSAIIT
jgi:acyl-CoA synthetase (AMP-forming)/AMP-acid ligase II